MGAMMVYWQRDKDLRWKAALEKLVTRLTEVAVDKGDYAYFFRQPIPFQGTWNKERPMPTGVWSVDNLNGRIIEQLGQYYALTGFAPTKTLGDKLIVYLRRHSQYFGPNGEWLKDQLDPKKYPGREDNIHFGTHSHALLYMTDYAISTKNKELQEYCRKSLEWAMHSNSSLPGQCETATRIGFFAEYQIPYYPTCEQCGTADMIGAALKLSEAGVGDYWDEADGWVRNQYIENQMTSSEWAYKANYNHPPRQPAASESVDHIAERNVGNYFGWASANDGCPLGEGHMQCCAGNGSRTLYYIWEAILGCERGTLTVNLLLNRASTWADVDSYIPYTGRVDLKIKKSLKEVKVRAPEWVASGSMVLKCTVDGQARPLTWEGRYIKLGAVESRQTVTLTFPIQTRTLKRVIYEQPLETVIGGVVYDSITFKGNEVIDIQPKGKYYPYYQRDYYRRNEPRLRTVERFVSEENIPW